MSESESESSDGKTFDDNSFPLENKYKSLEDKKYINSLSEIQREEILADRAAQVEREQQSRVLRELLKNRERGEGKADKKKRKADEEPEDGNRKTSRQRTTIGGRKVGESSAPLEEYKRQREQRGKENAQRRRDDASRPSKRKDDSSSDADADAESDVEWDDGKAKSGAGHKASPTEEMREPLLRDYDRLKIGHDQFGQVCFYPGFAEAISGCYGRVNLGPDKATGLNCYRMALIKGLCTI
jgi:RNA polymerase-associated protein RTF1